jgi:uncharacterized protein YecE (DUF72 family)
MGIHIGTSGWHYKHWLGKFYDANCPASEMLPTYLKTFETVEINNTFYALPQEKSVQNWYRIVPDEFRFAVKANRYITHIKRLLDPIPPLERFWTVASILKEKLGPILFQFPPNWQKNVDRLADFLPNLPAGHLYAFEFRHPTWYDEAVFKIMRDYNIAFCIYDRELKETPLEITSDNIYIRLHGSGHPYGGDYKTEHLEVWADRIADWNKQVKDIWVYFNNDWHGYAIDNAIELRNLLK